MLAGRRDADGALYISTAAPQPTDKLVGGVAITDAGVVRVTSGLVPQVFANGIGLAHIGAACVVPGGVIAGYNNGLPVTSDGRLVTQLNQPVSPGDAFVGGLRVGALGGLYTVDTTPPPEPFGFSAGFDSGFDIGEA